MTDFEYYTRWAVNHLKNRLAEAKERERKELKKSFAYHVDMMIEKSRGYPVGTIREWRGKKYKKLNSGKWARFYGERRSKADTRGINRTLKHLERKVAEIKSTITDSKEQAIALDKFLTTHIEQFKDKSGNVLKEARELHAKAQGYRAEKMSNERKDKRGKWEAKNGGGFVGDLISEKKRRKKLIRQMPIKIDTSDFKDLSDKECRTLAKQKYSLLKSVKKDGIKIEFKPFGFKETKAHSADKNNLYVLGKMDEILKNAVFMYKEPNTDERKTNTKDFLYYAAKTSINGKDYYTRIVVREDKDGNFYYDNDSTSTEKVRTNIDILLPAYQQQGFINNSPYIDRVSQWLAGVKLETNNKHDKAELKKQELKKVEVGVSPTITRQNGAPASNGHTGISTSDNIPQQAEKSKEKEVKKRERIASAKATLEEWEQVFKKRCRHFSEKEQKEKCEKLLPTISDEELEKYSDAIHFNIDKVSKNVILDTFSDETKNIKNLLYLKANFDANPIMKEMVEAEITYRVSQIF